MIAGPLNVGSSSDCPSWKSLNQPDVRADRRSSTGRTLQYFVYSVFCGRNADVDLEAELLELRLHDLGHLLARVGVGREHEDRARRVYLPSGSRPSSCTRGQRQVALVVLQVVEVGRRLEPAGLLAPGKSGGR